MYFSLTSKGFKIFFKAIIIFNFAQQTNKMQMKSKIHIDKSISNLYKTLLENKSAFVIIDNNLQHLAEHFKEFPQICLNFSEQKKSLATIEVIADKLLEMGADRDALIVGVGGGITTDITGFAASIYKRGVKFAFVPTTLLAQVDASIGGKNGINFNSYKNILGTINQPEWIYICSDVLETLPEKEFKAGIAEVLKTFILFDKEQYRVAVDYFAAVAKEFESQECAATDLSGRKYGETAARLNRELLTEIIGKCAGYKCGVVERDEFENGERRMLNLGHTFAHSIEKLTSGEISHGYAVAMGIVIAAKFADTLGVAQEGFTQMLVEDLRRAGLPALLEDCPLTAHLKIADLADAVKKDKKVTGGNIHFILPKGLQDVEDSVLPLEKIKEIANGLR